MPPQRAAVDIDIISFEDEGILDSSAVYPSPRALHLSAASIIGS